LIEKYAEIRLEMDRLGRPSIAAETLKASWLAAIRTVAVMLVVIGFGLVGALGVKSYLSPRLGTLEQLGGLLDKVSVQSLLDKVSVQHAKNVFNELDQRIEPFEFLRLQSLIRSDPQLLTQVGEEYVSQGQSTLAISYFKRAIAVDPDREYRRQKIFDVLEREKYIWGESKQAAFPEELELFQESISKLY
jgi:tetratricopeptide (TPR) repeat protein